MNGLKQCFYGLIFTIGSSIAYASINQTDEVSPIYSSATLPFQVSIELADFQLPIGLRSGVVGVYKEYWIYLAGGTDGLHGFDSEYDNFPPSAQNTKIYVINSITGASTSRSLYEPSAGLTQQQIDTLSVTNAANYQDGTTVYMAGGYGFDSNVRNFQTQPVLTAINLPGIFNWVTQNRGSVAQNIRQIYNHEFQISGGVMHKLGNLSYLMFGQNFSGPYNFENINGDYSRQIRQFEIQDVNGQLAVKIYPNKPQIKDPNFRRRDLNVVPSIFTNNNQLQYGFIAYSGVFTVQGGIWNVPIIIPAQGEPRMPDPLLDSTFKQGMNNYVCPTATLYSRKTKNNYTILFGGNSYGYFSNGIFETDEEVPFINQVTTIKMDASGNFTQYLMNGQYPTILSTGVNPGNQLLFGSDADFIPAAILTYPNTVISLDTIRKPTIIGHIVGGIMSTVPNTVSFFETSASPYVFKVILTPNQ